MCGLLQHDVVRGICTAFKCLNKTHLLTPEERNDMAVENHYLYTYADGQSQFARAHEHTASLSTNLRDEVEREFASGKINLLSCTTTMEMGVDLRRTGSRRQPEIFPPAFQTISNALGGQDAELRRHLSA